MENFDIYHIIIILIATIGWAFVVFFLVHHRGLKKSGCKIVDSDSRNTHIEELQQKLLFMNQAIAETDNLVVVTDNSGVIRFVNRPFYQFMGFGSDKPLLGKKLFEFTGFGAIREILEDAVERRSNTRTEVFITNKFNNRFWLQLAFSHIEAQSEHLVVIVGININDLKFAEEEISQQREELMVQSEQLESVNAELEHVNQVTTDSINYAERIQHAILPRQSDYLRYLQDSFVLFKPRDIVSGDFYWYGEVYEKTVYVEADSTGHGVPGALMATIGNTLLNEIVLSKNILNPAQILKELDIKIKELLRHDPDNPDQTEGMDITVVVYDPENRLVSISLAAQYMFLYHNGEFLELEGSLFGVGGVDGRGVEQDFDLYRYVVAPGDIAYMFSDGYRDQYSEGEGEKLMPQRFRAYIEKVIDLPLDEQKELLAEWFDKWRGNTRQFDDVLIWALQF